MERGSEEGARMRDNIATALVITLIGVIGFLVMMGIISMGDRYDKACAEAWAPLETMYQSRTGCLVLVDGHWTPDENIIVHIEGE